MVGLCTSQVFLVVCYCIAMGRCISARRTEIAYAYGVNTGMTERRVDLVQSVLVALGTIGMLVATLDMKWLLLYPFGSIVEMEDEAAFVDSSDPLRMFP